MRTKLSSSEQAKFVSARRAAGLVESGMKVGLGTGSTAAWLLRCLGWMAREEGLTITGVATSNRTEHFARRVGVPTVDLDEAGWLDLTIDGADEFDRDMNLIKGGGGALLREKVVAEASDRMVVIADSSKRVETLGAFPLPVAVIPFGWRTTKMLIERVLADMAVSVRASAPRMNQDDPWVTDEGNFILDLHLRRIDEPRRLSLALNQIPGVAENGLFIDVCDMVIVGHSEGRVEVRDIKGEAGGFEDIDIQGGEKLLRDFPE